MSCYYLNLDVCRVIMNNLIKKQLVTVAQRINGIGVHNVRIQVTVGMIDEDVSTLLFV